MRLSAFCIVALASVLAPAVLAVPIGTKVARADTSSWTIRSAASVQPRDNVGDGPAFVIPASQHYEEKRNPGNAQQSAPSRIGTGLQKINPVPNAVNRPGNLNLNKNNEKNTKFTQELDQKARAEKIAEEQRLLKSWRELAADDEDEDEDLFI